jgi:hypothetical protein
VTREEIIAVLAALGWTLVGEPEQTADGHRVTIERGKLSVRTTAPTEIEALADLLRGVLRRIEEALP